MAKEKVSEDATKKEKEESLESILHKYAYYTFILKAKTEKELRACIVKMVQDCLGSRQPEKAMILARLGKDFYAVSQETVNNIAEFIVEWEWKEGSYLMTHKYHLAPSGEIERRWRKLFT